MLSRDHGVLYEQTLMELYQAKAIQRCCFPNSIAEGQQDLQELNAFLLLL